MVAKYFLKRQLVISSKFHVEEASNVLKFFDHDAQIIVKFKQLIKVRLYNILKTVRVVEFCLSSPLEIFK